MMWRLFGSTHLAQFFIIRSVFCWLNKKINSLSKGRMVKGHPKTPLLLEPPDDDPWWYGGFWRVLRVKWPFLPPLPPFRMQCLFIAAYLYTASFILYIPGRKAPCGQLVLPKNTTQWVSRKFFWRLPDFRDGQRSLKLDKKSHFY